MNSALWKPSQQGQVCLTCHGTDISPAVTAKLKELYPKDIATGYKEGDIRGAFVAVKQLAQWT